MVFFQVVLLLFSNSIMFYILFIKKRTPLSGVLLGAFFLSILILFWSLSISSNSKFVPFVVLSFTAMFFALTHIVNGVFKISNILVSKELAHVVDFSSKIFAVLLPIFFIGISILQIRIILGLLEFN